MGSLEVVAASTFGSLFLEANVNDNVTTATMARRMNVLVFITLHI